MPFSDSYANNFLNFIFSRIDSLTSPDKVYIGLSSTDPEAGSFTELSGGAYGRILLVRKEELEYPDFIGTATNREISNKRQINWTKASSNWPTAVGFGLFTSETGGSPFYYAKLDKPVTVPAESVALFDPGEFKIAFSNTDVKQSEETTE